MFVHICGYVYVYVTCVCDMCKCACIFMADLRSVPSSICYREVTTISSMVTFSPEGSPIAEQPADPFAREPWEYEAPNATWQGHDSDSGNITRPK